MVADRLDLDTALQDAGSGLLPWHRARVELATKAP